MHIDKIEEFHKKVIKIKIPKYPCFPEYRDSILADRLIMEELSEYFTAKAKGELIEIADALGDLIVVIYQAAIFYGIPLGKVLEEIHKSNMSKVGGKRDSGGKFIKPPTWKAPDLFKILFPSLLDAKKQLNEIFKKTRNKTIIEALQLLNTGKIKHAYEKFIEFEDKLLKNAKKSEKSFLYSDQLLKKEFIDITVGCTEKEAVEILNIYRNKINALQAYLLTTEI